MPPAFPLSSEGFIARTTTPLPSDMVEHGSGVTAAWFGSR